MNNNKDERVSIEELEIKRNTVMFRKQYLLIYYNTKNSAILQVCTMRIKDLCTLIYRYFYLTYKTRIISV